MKNELLKLGLNAQKAFKDTIDEKIKNKVLIEFSHLLKKNISKILIENKKDISKAVKKGLRENIIKRLELNEYKIKQIISSVNKISKLKRFQILKTCCLFWKQPPKQGDLS